jgi:hypothetical protein
VANCALLAIAASMAVLVGEQVRERGWVRRDVVEALDGLVDMESGEVACLHSKLLWPVRCQTL